MAVDVKLNTLPESVEEGTLMAWHKQEGDAVEQDEKLADIETDKIVIEVAAPTDGVLSKILKQAGESVQADEILASIEAGAAPAPAAESPASESDATPEPVAEPAAPAEAVAPVPSPEPEPAAAPAEMDEEAAEELASARLSPAVRKLIEEHNLRVSHIMGTGRGGRIIKADVLRHIEAASTPDTERPEASRPLYNLGGGDEAAAPAPEAASAAPAEAPATANESGRTEQRVPMTRLRRRVAERLVQVQQEAALLTTFNEVDLSSVIDLRKTYQEEFQKAHGVKLGFMSFFVKAVIEGLKAYPLINASIDGDDILYHDYYDIGIAVSSPRGLVVPVLRDADRSSLGEVEQRILDFAGRAREGQLELSDLQGGTFTITNGGVFGSMLSTPIINPPQSAILGMHSIQQRPVALDGNVVIRPMMYLALSYDHRLIDGREAVSFLVTVKKLLEEPGRFLLNL